MKLCKNEAKSVLQSQLNTETFVRYVSMWAENIFRID